MSLQAPCELYLVLNVVRCILDIRKTKKSFLLNSPPSILHTKFNGNGNLYSDGGQRIS